jgi:haloacid dehalogenase superfamily, subfamily IA, variant 1 with third motif having Dx(3-4)D or Dx(3-4)E
MKLDSSLHPIFHDNVQGLIFDLDGTLIDSGGDIFQGMRMTFEQAGYDPLPEGYFPDNLHGTTGGIIRSIISDMGWAMPKDVRELEKLYMANSLRLDLQHTHMYDGALELLQRCGAAGIPMGVCTNKSQAGAQHALRKFKLDSMFRFVTGCDTWAEAKPSPIPLIETARMLGIAPEHCLYFGDTSTDAQSASAANIRFVLHESGYGDAELHGKPRHFTFHKWAELLYPEEQATFL